MAGGGPALGMIQSAVAARRDEVPSRLGAWLDGYGLLGDVEGDGNTDDLDYTIYGGTLGVDYRLSPHLLIGAAGGYASSDLDYDSRTGSYDVDTYQGALYVGYVRPGYHLGASARYAFSEYDTSRKISFGNPAVGGFDSTATGDFDGSAFGGHLEAGIDGFGVGSLLVQPVASLSYTHISQDSYTESGAASLNLRVDNEDVDSLVSGLGARLYGRFDMGEGVWMTPELRVRWTHEFGDDDRRVHARLDGATAGGDFVVESAEISSDSVLVGVAWTVTTRDRLQVFAEYDAVLNEDLIEHSFSAGVRLIW